MKTLFAAITFLLLASPAFAQSGSSDSGSSASSSPHRHHRVFVGPGIRIESDGEDRDDNGSDEDSDDGDVVFQMPGIRVRHGHERSDQVSAAAAVKGPVKFRLVGVNADLVVVPSASNEVKVTIGDSDVSGVTIAQRGDDRVELQFPEGRLHGGQVHLELPRGSSVDLASLSGDVSVRGLEGDARVRSTSGDVVLEGVKAVDAQTVSGDVQVNGASGPFRVKTVSGDVDLASNGGAATQLDFESASGELSFAGACGKGCQVDASSLSGNIQLSLEEHSSFELEYRSNGGEVEDDLGVTPKDSGHHRRFRATYGKGEGIIDAESFSGELTLQKCEGDACRKLQHAHGRKHHAEMGGFHMGHFGIPPVPPVPSMPPLAPVPPAPTRAR